MKYIWIIVFLSFSQQLVSAQENKYWVFFTDKENVEFNPYQYFHPKAIERRKINGVAINHISDYPVDSAYLNKLKKEVTNLSYTSRWLNAVAVWATTSEIDEVKQLPFVSHVLSMPKLPMHIAQVNSQRKDAKPLTKEELALMKAQIASFSPQAFFGREINGKGVRVAVFDAGFPSVDEHRAFTHLREQNKIVATYDFVAKKENVYGANAHGCNVLSNIAGKLGDTLLGLATDVEVLLARTERGLLENFAEEENWVAALEWADKNGADVVNSSLGYTQKRYFTTDLDGKTALVSRVANMAASKGIIVVNSAGNEGDSDWKFIGAPADADSIISVGGIDPFNASRISFSSFGPTADLRMKPNVSAFGHAVVAGKDLGLHTAYGTSFSSPLLCGFVACARQAYPEMPAMALIQKIYESAHLYPYYDYAIGYGIPQADKLLNEDAKPSEPTFELNKVNDELRLSIPIDHFDPPEYFAEIDSLQEVYPEQLLFYHFENEAGFLSEYGTIIVESNSPIEFSISEMYSYKTLRIHYRGYTESYNIKEFLE